jgi:hypothetical protein
MANIIFGPSLPSDIQVGYGNLPVLPVVLRFSLAPGIDAVAGQTSNRQSLRRSHTLLSCRALADTVPTGQSLIATVEKSTNGTSWTDLWNGDTTKRPAILASADLGETTVFDSTVGAAGTRYRAKIVQAGSTAAGQNITVELEVMSA